MKTWRLEIYNTEELEKFSSSKTQVLHGKVVYLTGKSADQTIQAILEQVLVDPLTERGTFKPIGIESQYIADKVFKFGVTDNLAHSIKECIGYLFKDQFTVQTGEIYHFQKEPQSIYLKSIHNPLIHRLQTAAASTFQTRFETIELPKANFEAHQVQHFDFSTDLDQLEIASKKNLWALNREELSYIKKYFTSATIVAEREKLGLTSKLTDVEIEVLAQTWSEHCKHKIFNADIEYTEDNLHLPKVENSKINSIFKTYIRGASEDVINDGVDWTISLFHDNAGIVRFDEKIDVCAKVETHNSPSALDPYGGALTGILGVNRDILGCGMGAEPIANTNVFCVGSQQKIGSEISLPKELLDPKSILDGVHEGVKDGGNKSGIPTVNGAIVFDDDYMGKPLVYCGTIGVLPPEINGKPSSEKPYQKGDLIVMIGGRVGMDGIHGATFSSLELDEDSPSSAVQIGDPFTQKRVLDFVIDARDKGLFSGITDNGAGGLSSSVGEMAEKTNGALLKLDQVPLKYPGLSPYQIMISESQERMSVAVPPALKNKFFELAKKYSVEATVVGEFTNTGFLEVTYQKQIVAHLDLEFLHSPPPLRLKAHFKPQTNRQFWHQKDLRIAVPKTDAAFTMLLQNSNIRSKAHYVRQYDHEVKASTLIKPFGGKKQCSPNNSGLVKLDNFGGTKGSGLFISCGIAPKFSYYDTYLMTQYVVDEAIRNVVAQGANPDKIALLDNYCWADPVATSTNPEGEQRLAQLVRSCEGLYRACRTFKAPLISGKDSMKNNFKSKDGTAIAIAPTLLVTCISHTDDYHNTVTADFKNENDLIYFISPYTWDEMFNELTISEYTYQFKTQVPTLLQPDLTKHRDLYVKLYQNIQAGMLKSCHDISDGGMMVAIAEACFGNHLGAKLSFNNKNEVNHVLFNEPPGSFIASIQPADQLAFEKAFPEATIIGTTAQSPRIEVNFNSNTIIDKSILELESLWSGNHVY